MANVKTTVSLQKSLLEQVETLAREMKVSRNRVFVLALENFIRDYQDKQLFDKINKAVEEAPPDKTERSRLRQIRQQQAAFSVLLQSLGQTSFDEIEKTLAEREKVKPAKGLSPEVAKALRNRIAKQKASA